MKEFEDFLRLDNNSCGRPTCIIIKGIREYECPMDSLGIVLYDITKDGLDLQIERLHFFSSSLWGF